MLPAIAVFALFGAVIYILAMSSERRRPGSLSTLAESGYFAAWVIALMAFAYIVRY